MEYQRQFGLDALAEEHGFGVVYPQGTWDENWVPHWNADLTISEVDDIGYLVALAESMQETHGYDPERTYTSGISNGGFMSYTLACRASDTFRAMGSIIGTMSQKTWEDCAPETPISVLQISGAQDTVVPIDGSMDEEADGVAHRPSQTSSHSGPSKINVPPPRRVPQVRTSLLYTTQNAKTTT